jgi:hypothetical protein
MLVPNRQKLAMPKMRRVRGSVSRMMSFEPPLQKRGPEFGPRAEEQAQSDDGDGNGGP